MSGSTYAESERGQSWSSTPANGTTYPDPLFPDISNLTQRIVELNLVQTHPLLASCLTPVAILGNTAHSEGGAGGLVATSQVGDRIFTDGYHWLWLTSRVATCGWQRRQFCG